MQALERMILNCMYINCTLHVPVLHELQFASIVHKYYHHPDFLPDIFRNNYFTRNSTIQQYNTRRHSDLHIHRVNSSQRS